MGRIYRYENFIYEPVPGALFHRLGGLEHMFVGWSNLSGQPLYWTVDKGRDLFIIPMTGSADEVGEGGGLPVPLFLLGYRDNNFTVEFLHYKEKQEPENGRLLYLVSYKQGLLRLPEALRPEAETMLGLVHDAILAYRQASLRRINDESGDAITRIIESLHVEVDTIAYFSEHFP